MITIFTILSIISALLIGDYSLKALNIKKPRIKRKKSDLSIESDIYFENKIAENTSINKFNELKYNCHPCMCFLSDADYSTKSFSVQNTDNDKCFVLMGDHICFGRVQSCDIVVNDHSISRIHFEIEITDGIVRIKDCQSMNGTFLNGKRIEDEGILLPGDIIKIGETSLIYQGTT